MPHMNARADEKVGITSLEAEILERIRALPEKSTASVRRLRQEFSRNLKTANAETILELVRRLMKSSNSLTRFFGTELLHYHPDAFRKVDLKELERLGRGNSDWGSVDMFACFLSGPAWRNHQISDEAIEKWAQSNDLWWRRTAIVSTVPLNSRARGGTGDALRTLKVCKLLVDDREEMVVKALSWALRELGKRNQTAVKNFLVEYDSSLAPRVKRDVKNKLATGLKNPRKLAAFRQMRRN